MKKIIVIALSVLAIILACSIYYFSYLPNKLITKVDTSTWKTYTDSTTGFIVKYPPEYIAENNSVTTDTPWVSRTLLTIHSARNEPQLGTPDFSGTFIQGTLTRQPEIHDGKTYHNVIEYQQHGMTRSGSTNPRGELVTINSNGLQALMYQDLSAEDGSPIAEVYLFIKDDFIYTINFSINNPNKKAILGSIAWQ